MPKSKASVLETPDPVRRIVNNGDGTITIDKEVWQEVPTPIAEAIVKKMKNNSFYESVYQVEGVYYMLKSKLDIYKELAKLL